MLDVVVNRATHDVGHRVIGIAVKGLLQIIERRLRLVAIEAQHGAQGQRVGICRRGLQGLFHFLRRLVIFSFAHSGIGLAEMIARLFRYLHLGDRHRVAVARRGISRHPQFDHGGCVLHRDAITNLFQALGNYNLIVAGRQVGDFECAAIVGIGGSHIFAGGAAAHFHAGIVDAVAVDRTYPARNRAGGDSLLLRPGTAHQGALRVRRDAGEGNDHQGEKFCPVLHIRNPGNDCGGDSGLGGRGTQDPWSTLGTAVSRRAESERSF